MWNVELHAEVVTTVACNSLRGGSDFTNRPPETTFVTEVSLPCIVNSKAIDAGTEVALKCNFPFNETGASHKRHATWVDGAANVERTRFMEKST